MNIRIAYAAKIAVLLILLGLGVAKGAEVTKESYTITMKDGTVLVGAVQINRVKFNASYGSVDVSLGEILTFNDGFLTLADGTKLKGTFPSGSLDLVTTRGTLNLMFASIVSIGKASAIANTPATTTTAASGPPAASTVSAANLVGKVIDCFGKALPGASVMVKNTRFVTTTDNQGNYSLGYVPGKIQVSFTKQGYYETGLTFEISAPAAYPVQDLCMFKVLPSQGILFIGDTDYIKSTSSVNVKQRQGSGPASRQEMEYDYYVTGQPVALAGLDADLSFVINAPNRSAITGMTTTDPNLGVALFRVQPGGFFFRKTEAGFGGVLGSQSSGERLKVGTVSGVGDMFRLWRARLDPGLYALTMEVEDMGGGSFGDPCFFFQVTSSGPTSHTTTERNGLSDQVAVPSTLLRQVDIVVQKLNAAGRLSPTNGNPLLLAVLEITNNTAEQIDTLAIRKALCSRINEAFTNVTAVLEEPEASKPAGANGGISSPKYFLFGQVLKAGDQRNTSGQSAYNLELRLSARRYWLPIWQTRPDWWLSR